jgi:predicted RNA-binding protein with PUA-like domain
MNWLVKEEPSHYPYDALVADGRTTWSGVENPLAQKHLRAIRKGDRVFYYHTGDQKAIVGVARALGDACADPDDPSGRLFVVDVGPVQKLAVPVTLARIKADEFFADFPLTRMPRLSVMPVTDDQWKRIESMSRQGADGAAPSSRLKPRATG